MSPTAKARNRDTLATFFRLLLADQFPHLMGTQVHVVVQDGADYLFTVQPFQAGVVVSFANSAAARADLLDVVREAGASAEQHVHGLTRAVRTQLDAIDWWIWRQRQLPCTD